MAVDAATLTAAGRTNIPSPVGSSRARDVPPSTNSSPVKVAGDVARGAAAVAGEHDGAGKVAATAEALDVPRAAAPPQREFTRRIDKETGDVVLEHASQEATPRGMFTLKIEIRMHRDGTLDRVVDQKLDAGSGNYSTSQTKTSFSSEGKPVREHLVSHVHVPGQDQLEDTTTKFDVDGVPVHRHSVQTRRQGETKPDGTKEQSEQVIDATYDAGGKPIGDKTVPQIRFRERATSSSPTGGITKKGGRLLTVERTASGPADRLQWDPMRLTVRFNGSNNGYIERQLQYRLDERGQTVGEPKIVKEIDKQAPLDKGFYQARVWGPIASYGATMAGIRLLPHSPTLAKALIWGGVGVSGTATVGHGHALATQRNDASAAHLVMSGYDTVFQGLLASAITRRAGLGTLSANHVNQATALAATSFGANAIVRPEVLPGVKLGDAIHATPTVGTLATGDTNKIDDLRRGLAAEGETRPSPPPIDLPAIAARI